MSDHIVLPDGRAWVASSQIVSAVLREASTHVPSQAQALAAWLKDRSEMPNGLIGFDCRSVPPRHRAEIVLVLGTGATALSARGAWPGGRLDRLGEMLECVRRGEPPMELNDFSDVVPSLDETYDIE